MTTASTSLLLLSGSTPQVFPVQHPGHPFPIPLYSCENPDMLGLEWRAEQTLVLAPGYSRSELSPWLPGAPPANVPVEGLGFASKGFPTFFRYG
jgi:hypothetical protein